MKFLDPSKSTSSAFSLALWLSVGSILSPAPAEGLEPCRIEVVERGTGWPVPLVELRTNHHARFVTDNAGLIAFDLPELMGQETWFGISAHGYGVPKDGFGSQGVRLTPEPGKTLKVEVERNIIAKRIGRVTGAGRFAESQKLGEATDWQEFGGVLGCDSIQNAVHRGKLHWLWGDTTLSHYPLGIFDGTAATTPIQALDSFEPPLTLQLKYFTDDRGKARGIAKMPGSGPTWISGYVSLPDRGGEDRLVGTYMKINPPLEAYEWGLCVWNDDKEAFEHFRTLWKKSEDNAEPPPRPDGHPSFWTDEAGKEWVLFGNPLPNIRFPKSFEAWQDANTWEVLTPQEFLTAAGNEEQKVRPHSGSIAWNPFRKRWVTVFMEYFGKPSVFGELWYAEAKSPEGPWGPAIKVLSHDNYTFYNPRIHPEFTPEDSPILIFEGTYTIQFADKPEPTARYDYNQILYRLDLDDPQLAPAQLP